ncbi:MAG: hypothetical protein CM1200mP32_10980 [Methanobacteriota archaeon]|nr:MAG: hypothetical protein CM1200mP32_10980 [Euryarchaeota archaeon]
MRVARSISTPERSRSAGSSQRLSIEIPLGGPRLRSGLCSFHDSRIAPVSTSGPSRHSLRVTGEPSTPPLNSSFMVGPSDFLSIPNVVATLPFGFEVDQKHPASSDAHLLIAHGQRGGDVDRSGGLGAPTLVVHDCDDYGPGHLAQWGKATGLP